MKDGVVRGEWGEPGPHGTGTNLHGEASYIYCRESRGSRGPRGPTPTAPGHSSQAPDQAYFPAAPGHMEGDTGTDGILVSTWGGGGAYRQEDHVPRALGTAPDHIPSDRPGKHRTGSKATGPGGASFEGVGETLLQGGQHPDFHPGAERRLTPRPPHRCRPGVVNYTHVNTKSEP